MDDTISRQVAIDTLNVGAELLRRVLDETDVVGTERAKYEWGLGLIESCISDMKDLPFAQSEIIRCKDCKHRPYKDEDGDVWAPSLDDEICPCICEDCYYNWMPEDDFFCKRGERREDEID